ncbi:predicted protein [Arabidopsis lyrata subsp. lyrata]|uniref:Predicted protein n=1 Tax=Arabidopsis lyrata subsp. lyrata TaxID=81972 RepID=D7LNG0_ARALL|nr:predicted protein [Arabidopsis lyrata subsp. lyrata]
MANRENQNHALCLLESVVVHVFISAISIQIPTSILAPSFLLHTLSPLKDVYLYDHRIRFLFIQKSVCPESVFCFHWIRHAGVSPLSEISDGWWKLSLLDKVRPPKPPWMSSTFHASSRLWDRTTIFILRARRITIIGKTNGGCELYRRRLHRLRCFVKDYDRGKVGLELFLHMSHVVDLDYRICSTQTYDVRWMGTHESSLKYLEDALGFEKYLTQQLWKRGHCGKKEETIANMRKRHQRLISKKIISKSNFHRTTRLRKCWYLIVIAPEYMMEALGLTMQCAI